MTSHREIKDTLYDQVARLAKAVASPKRLELIELLCQEPKDVDALATEAGISVKLASAHLKELKAARLVVANRDGRRIIHRLAAPAVADLWVALRTLSEDRLTELKEAIGSLRASVDEWLPNNRDELMRQARSGDVIIIDVRPASEYAAGHLPHARSLPLRELKHRLAELPTDKPIVAYCRGPFCLMAADAAALLGRRGYTAFHLRDGVAEWRVHAPRHRVQVSRSRVDH